VRKMGQDSYQWCPVTGAEASTNHVKDSRFKQKTTFMVEHWNRLSREVVEAPSLETAQADWMFLSNLLKLIHFEREGWSC